MHEPALFTWRHVEADLLRCAVRWSLRYPLRSRDVEERLRARGLLVAQTTVLRWGQRAAPELDRRCRPQLNATHASHRVDDTDIKIKKPWHYRYRAVDARGATLDCMLSATRDADAAERCFRQVLQASHPLTPRVITVEKNAAAPPAFDVHQPDGPLPEPCLLRPCQ